MVKRIIGVLFLQCKRMGLDGIGLVANKGIGGFVWTKYGYYCINKQETLQSVRKSKQLQDIVNDYYKGRKPSEPFPMSLISNHPKAKDALTGMHWVGGIDLNNEEECKYYENYISIP